jgi:cobalt-precorrin 5A hydrolase/precorrin-3B C17-methyltransferase
MRVTSLSVTEPGRELARRLPFDHVHGNPRAALASQWHEVDAFVAVLAVGAVVRMIAPLLSDKARDPAVVCVDDAGRHAVVVCGGHAGGGNTLARQVAGLIGAQPVITTATDVLGAPGLDQIPGMVATGGVARATAALLAGGPVNVQSPQGWPVPEPLAARHGPGGPAVVITDEVGPAGALALHPRSLVVGVGTSTDATPADLGAAVDRVLDRARLAPASVGWVATIDRRAGHPAVTALADRFGVPVVAFGSDDLGAAAVPNPSERVRQAVGTGSVAEAAALLAAGSGAALVAGKAASGTVTVAVARRAGPVGSVRVVGLGPGGAAHRSPAAETAVRHADVVAGYSAYVDQCADLLGPGQEVARFPLGTEIERARFAATAAAAGRHVALVCSGDAGVYAMASPLLELAGGVPVEVVPGITASLAAAAVLGAPLGHDHAVVSLSDLHTPWEVIAGRIAAAGSADFVLVLYNPRSTRRTWQIEAARDILLAHRAPGTPVGIVTDAGRPGERSVLATLEALPCDEVTMTSCVIVGSSTTVVVDGRMVTPRGYDR